MKPQVALVTGAAYGIGRAVATAFAAAGYAVAITAEVAPTETEREVIRLGGVCVSFVHDFSRPDAARSFVSAAAAELGGVDVLVNNAAATAEASIADTDRALLDRLLAINLVAPFLATRAALPHLTVSRGGSVVHISSVHAARALPHHAAYAATKGALEALTRAQAVEVAPLGIRVNAVAPGLVRVPRIADATDVVNAGRDIPLGRIGEAEEIAGAVLFLAGPAASYISGQVLVADGGLAARMAFDLRGVDAAGPADH